MEIALRPIAVAEDAPPRSRILAGGADTGAVADGVVLEATFEVAPGRLLFVTDDVPYEEGLNIQLYDHDWRRLDAATIGWPGVAGRLDGPERLDAARFRFGFLGGGPIELTVADAPHLRVPLIGGVAGIVRRPGLSGWLRFRRVGDG